MLQRDFLHNNQICYRGTSYTITRYVTERTLTQKPACYRENSYTEYIMSQRERLKRNYHVTEGNHHLRGKFHRKHHVFGRYFIKPSCHRGFCFCLFDLILYIPSTIFQLNRDESSWVEPVLSKDFLFDLILYVPSTIFQL